MVTHDDQDRNPSTAKDENNIGGPDDQRTVNQDAKANGFPENEEIDLWKEAVLISPKERLKLFVELTYGFILLRLFMAFYLGIWRTWFAGGDLYPISLSEYVNSISNSAFRVGFDSLCLAATTMVLMVYYFFVIHVYPGRYRYRFFIFDIVISFGFFAVAQSLQNIAEVQYLENTYTWLGVSALGVAIAFRLLLTRPSGSSNPSGGWFVATFKILIFQHHTTNRAGKLKSYERQSSALVACSLLLAWLAYIVRIPPKTATQSNRCRPPNPGQGGHPFRRMPATCRSAATWVIILSLSRYFPSMIPLSVS